MLKHRRKGRSRLRAQVTFTADGEMDEFKLSLITYALMPLTKDTRRRVRCVAHQAAERLLLQEQSKSCESRVNHDRREESGERVDCSTRLVDQDEDCVRYTGNGGHRRSPRSLRRRARAGGTGSDGQRSVANCTTHKDAIDSGTLQDGYDEIFKKVLQPGLRVWSAKQSNNPTRPDHDQRRGGESAARRNRRIAPIDLRHRNI